MTELEKIKEILFPEITKKTIQGIEFNVDSSIDYSLMAVLMELEHGVNDETSRNFIKEAISRLEEVRKIFLKK
jgi:hypothetical protein